MNAPRSEQATMRGGDGSDRANVTLVMLLNRDVRAVRRVRVGAVVDSEL